MTNQQIMHHLKNIFKNLKFDLKQNLFVGKTPSLKFITLNKIVIHLWHHQLSGVDMSLLCDFCMFYKMEIYKKQILERIPLLLIPKDCEDLLKQMIDYFENILESFFLKYNHFNYLSLDNFNNYWDNICFTQQGTINYIKTASQLIDNTSLSTEEKFVLACKNCLEDKVINLLNLLPVDIIKKYDNIYNCLIMYWTRYIKRDLNNFISILQTSNYWDYLIVESIREEDQVAVQYIWEQTAKKTMHSLNYFMSVNKEENKEICLYLFQQMNENQLLDLEEVDAIKLLLKRLEIVSQQCVVPSVATYIYDLITKFDVFTSFEILLYCWDNDIIRDCEYVTLWGKLSLCFKDDIDEMFIEFCTEFISSFMLKRLDLLSFKLLLTNTSSANKKQILNKINGIKYCIKMISIGGIDLLNENLNQIFENKKEISEWKKKIFDQEILELCVELTLIHKCNLINSFLTDYVPENQISKIKRNLPFKDNANFIRCISEKYKDKYWEFDFLEALNHFLFWCFEGNEKEIKRFNSLVFDIDASLYCDKKDLYFAILKDLTKHCKWELIEKNIKWIYFVQKDIERTTKEKLAHVKKFLKLIYVEEPYVLEHKNFVSYTKLLKMFITSCFKQNEVDDLKEELDRDYFFLNLVGLLIEFEEYNMCDDLLFWRFSSEKAKVDAFKQAFMRSQGYNYILNFAQECRTMYQIRLLLKWFNPGCELMILFRADFNNFVELERKLITRIWENDSNDKRLYELWYAFNLRFNKCREIIEILKSEVH